MSNVFVITKPGYSYTEDIAPENCSIYVNQSTDYFLIKEHSRGSESVAAYTADTITHSLGYIPMYLAYYPVSAGRYRIASNYDTLSGGSGAYVDTSDLYLNNTSGSAVTFKYYIFYDKVNV